MKEATFEKPHTFAEAVQFLREGHAIDYEVLINTNQGALMIRETWLQEAKEGGFIDYDGYGSQLTEEGKFIGTNIRPSTANQILPETAYILWYNR